MLDKDYDLKAFNADMASKDSTALAGLMHYTKCDQIDSDLKVISKAQLPYLRTLHKTDPAKAKRVISLDALIFLERRAATSS
jgi:hypothetical protein